MNKVLILYPQAFTCQSKFDRKVTNIISQMQECSIIFPSDPNQLVFGYFSRKFPAINISCQPDWQTVGITHAIIFADGEEFVHELEAIKCMGISYRLIRIKITRVVNIKKEEKYAPLKSTPDYEYIGRGSYWGNPYSMYGTGDDREEVIRKFKYDFDYEKFPNKKKDHVFKLAGKRLGCFCKPEACHGDVLADFLNQWDDGQ
jgi:hypothetical protein